MRVRKHAVVIAGAGPTGLMLAGELALAGTDVLIVEPRASQRFDGARARGLHSRTIEVLDQRGIADRFLAEGQPMQIQSFGEVRLDISDFPTRYNYGLVLSQSQFERILAGWVEELGVPIARGRAVTGFAQDEADVDVALSDGARLRADYLVGCDGGRSVVRKAAGIEFPGMDPTTSWMIAEVKVDVRPEFGVRNGGGIGPALDGERVGIVLAEPSAGPAGEPSLAEFRAALIAAEGTDYGAHSPSFLSRFTDMTRQAASYRAGRVLIAGDAAQVRPPQGGQGLNTGVQDAVNLGWKLAQVTGGTSPDSLLDSYHAERHPVGALVQRNSLAQNLLRDAGPRAGAMRDVMAELLSMDEPRKRFAGMVTGLDIHYDLGEGHPLLGRRMPDLDLVSDRGPVRVHELLHRARPVLLNLGSLGGFDVTPWGGRVRLIDAAYGGSWELPVLGSVSAPAAVLIRPDGYVAWAGDLGDPGLGAALATWFGAPAGAVVA
jgi:2-polyprenyl-6-methoxyphenol hydroxylase-like FAD-dependent oxidoreductase